MTGRVRIPQLTPQQVQDHLREMRALYAERALPKPPMPPPVKPEPVK